MKSLRVAVLLTIVALLVPGYANAREISPFVTTAWLEQNLGNPKLVTLDVRKVEDYREGHISGAVNAFLGSWTRQNNGLLLELPADDDLLELTGSLGIQKDSLVVVVGKGETDFDRADATRVGWTLIVAGVKNVAVLDGGYRQWIKERKPISTTAVKPVPAAYKGAVDKTSLASKSYVMSKIGKSVILDNRNPGDYFGITTAPYAPKPGHIKSALNLPTPWAFDKEGLMKKSDEIKAMTEGLVGTDSSREVIVYCGVGGYAATWWYLLTQVMGFNNVKLFDGSAQEWTADPNAPLTAYSWH
jgi:thiosulfate/3-mercaptopyruvate sulfurtransferase